MEGDKTKVRGFIKQSDDLLDRLASLPKLTNEQPHPNCLGSQLMGVHLLEHRFLVFFVAHGEESIWDKPHFPLGVLRI